MQANGVNTLYKIKQQVKYEKSADFQNKKKPYEKKNRTQFLKLRVFAYIISYGRTPLKLHVKSLV